MKYKPRAEEERRTVLADVIPIDTPYVFGFFVGDICNFHCAYCLHAKQACSTIPSNPKAVENRGARDLVKEFMSWETFQRIADQLECFPHKIKKILFSSTGEPLLHPKIAEMIAHLNQRGIAETYELVTNASRLSPALSRALVDAGLSRLCVSVQGVTAEQYKNICAYNMDMEEFISNLRFFYEYSRGKCRVHIKTVDIALRTGEKDIFLSMFGDCCDTIHIDHVLRLYQGVDYNGLVDHDFGLYKDQPKNIEVCSPLFYTLYVTPAGDVVPCCIVPYAAHYGSVYREDLVAIWNGTKRRRLLEQHLQKKRWMHSVCKECVLPNATAFAEDLLDDRAEQILARLSPWG